MMLDHRTTIYNCPECHQTFRTANTVFTICPDCQVDTVYDPVCEERDKYLAALERIEAKGCDLWKNGVPKEETCRGWWPLKDEENLWCPSCIATKTLEEGAMKNGPDSL